MCVAACAMWARILFVGDVLGRMGHPKRLHSFQTGTAPVPSHELGQRRRCQVTGVGYGATVSSRGRPTCHAHTHRMTTHWESFPPPVDFAPSPVFQYRSAQDCVVHGFVAQRSNACRISGRGGVPTLARMMTAADLRPDQRAAVVHRLQPTTGYLIRLAKRMQQLGFSPR
jgi:hypothetical protein